MYWHFRQAEFQRGLVAGMANDDDANFIDDDRLAKPNCRIEAATASTA
jgi:hypothetical protein